MRPVETAPVQQWLAALRSGEFVQGEGDLRTVNCEGVVHHCVLGVAYELAVRAGVAVWESTDGQDASDDGYLPEHVATGWLGLVDGWGPMRQGDSLAELNDTGMTFAELADLIESEPAGLFTTQEAT